MSQSRLIDAVQAAIASDQGELNFNPAVLDAMRLSELFEYIKPTDYVLPLDAMAGIPNPAFKA